MRIVHVLARQKTQNAKIKIQNHNSKRKTFDFLVVALTFAF